MTKIIKETNLSESKEATTLGKHPPRW